MERAAYDEMRALEDGHWWFRGKRRMVTPLIARALAAAPLGSLLEVGCGTGGNLALLAERFPQAAALGIDLDAGALAYCAERGTKARLLRGDGTRLPLRSGSLGGIVALDVIEHFEDDGALLAEFHRALAPGGELVASVPAYPFLWSPHDEFLHHQRRYRRGELEARLVDAGFELRERYGFNFLLLPLIAGVRLLRRGGGGGTDFFELPRPLNALLAGLFAIEAALVRVLPIRFGVSLMVRARRPPGPAA